MQYVAEMETVEGVGLPKEGNTGLRKLCVLTDKFHSWWNHLGHGQGQEGCHAECHQLGLVQGKLPQHGGVGECGV